MLIFTRRVGQTVVIGDDITISFLAVKSNHVRVGIHARKDIPVHRGEIHQRIKQGTESARVVRKPRLTMTLAQT
jgi:carbon storage regulator